MEQQSALMAYVDVFRWTGATGVFLRGGGGTRPNSLPF